MYNELIFEDFRAIKDVVWRRTRLARGRVCHSSVSQVTARFSCLCNVDGTLPPATLPLLDSLPLAFQQSGSPYSLLHAAPFL
ncbi:hypothetical protein ARMGADRAFT_1013407 [Armillaria gallica]|uniref:Uncharacterized protein n=1 Tax=Armillaria gallica TaxID=47427 RepID=A0A2H3DEG3_ARMGA|nr:hypothetical protein ARMGADRAFT_1013407 [Armillaria gallica]